LFVEDDIIIYYDAVNKREADSSAMLNAREGLDSIIASRKRREEMRPMVEDVDKEFAHLPARKRVTAVKKALMNRIDFLHLLPKDLKDPRFIKGDIESILLPPPESFEEQVDDDEMTNSEPLSDLLREMGVDPDEL
jgi:hypothetical protein